MSGTPTEPTNSQSPFFFVIKVEDVAALWKIYFLQAGDRHLNGNRSRVFNLQRYIDPYWADPLGINAVIKPSIQNLKFYPFWWWEEIKNYHYWLTAGEVFQDRNCARWFKIEALPDSVMFNLRQLSCKRNLHWPYQRLHLHVYILDGLLVSNFGHLRILKQINLALYRELQLIQPLFNFQFFLLELYYLLS